MRAAFVLLLLLVVPLSGCSDGGGAAGGGPDAPGPDGAAGNATTLLWFAAAERPVLEDTFTVTVRPEDACLPAGCPLASATGGQDPSFVKVIDISDAFPQGLHAFVEVRAVYATDPSDGADVLGNWDLQWWSRDLWTSGTRSDDQAGNASISGFATNHGPDPATVALIILEPDGGAQQAEVTVHVRVTPLDDAVHPSHVVGVSLGGGAVPVTTELEGQGVLHVRGPDDLPVASGPVENGTVVMLPPDSPPGEYRLVVFGEAGPVGFRVPDANLSTPLMRVLDTTSEDGAPRPVPANGVLTWDVDVQRVPYLFRVRFDGLDGRSGYMDARLTVTAPDGSQLIDADVSCDTCLYSLRSWGSLASDSLTAGTYTVTLEVQAAQGWRVFESVGFYGR